MKEYTSTEVFEASVEYFNGDELAARVFTDKYDLQDNEGNYLELTPEDMHHRLAKEFARIEKKKYEGSEMKPLTEQHIFNYFDRFKYIIPQGSPMYGIGNNNQTVSLSNCFVLSSPVDSYGGILKTDEELVQMCKRRGGVGLDISNLRPANTVVHNAAKTSTGIISFMERYSNSIREVGQSGRRGALMLTLDVHHPEIVNFATIKNDLTKVTGANISVKLSNEFLSAVKNDTEYELRFPIDYRQQGIQPKFSKMVQAKDVWDILIKNAHAMAEPGLLFWDNIINESLPDCYADQGFKTVCTNPCGEIPLSEQDSCRLLVLNLYSFVKNPFTKDAVIDWYNFGSTIMDAQRLMDDIIDLEVEKLDKIIEKILHDPEDLEVKRRELQMWVNVRQNTLQGRRTGLGPTAWGDTLAALGIGYGTDESVKKVEEVSRFIKRYAYLSSANMAKAIGAFPIWDHEREKNNPFLNRIKLEDKDLYEYLKKYGRRNIAILTAAPTGSVSILTQTTSGIEPLFMLSYKRRKKINPDSEGAQVDFIDQNGDKWQEYIVYHSRVNDWMKATGETDITKSPWYGFCAEDINWENRVRLQAAAQRHIDHSISSTINLPENITVDEVKDIYETAWTSGCKGVTVYRKNSRTGVMVEDKKEKNKETLTKHDAPKRPKELNAEVHHFKIDGEEHYVTVGMMEDEPYEIFVGKDNEDLADVFIPRTVKFGKIVKFKRGEYKLVTDVNTYFISGHHFSDEIEALNRMVSTTLRHGVDISFVVHQLEKTKGFLTSYTKALARTLKKYIKDGTKVSGETCPECKSESLIREDGCVRCAECGWTKCQ